MADKKHSKQNNVINMSNIDLKGTTSEIGGYIESNIDLNLLFIVLFLVGFGLLMVYSASSYVALRDFGDSSYFFRKQIIADVLGIFCMIVTLFIPLQKIERFKYTILILAYLVILLVIPFGIWAIRYYYRKTAYICPQCHEVFRPTMKEMIFANHTPKTRKLTCTKCGHHGFCVEMYGGDIK